MEIIQIISALLCIGLLSYLFFVWGLRKLENALRYKSINTTSLKYYRNNSIPLKRTYTIKVKKEDDIFFPPYFIPPF